MSFPSTATAYGLARGEGPALWHLGALATFKATSETTGGQFWMQEVLGERGYASPLHRHTREDEAFFVLEGALSVYVGDEIIRAESGSFLWAPRDIAHAFCVESARAKFLALSTPGGFDRFFFATGEPATALTVPSPAQGSPDIDGLIRVMGEYGVEMVGPPPSPRDDLAT